MRLDLPKIELSVAIADKLSFKQELALGREINDIHEMIMEDKIGTDGLWLISSHNRNNFFQLDLDCLSSMN